MLAAIANFGHNASAVWLFAAGVLAVLLLAAVLIAGITAIRRFLDA